MDLILILQNRSKGEERMDLNLQDKVARHHRGKFKGIGLHTALQLS